jgi:dipeptidyl aminopeptidase/acylaminoacyl peptidase
MAKKVLTVVLVVAALVLVATFALSRTGRIGSVPPEQRSDTLRQEEGPYRPYMGWYELEPAHHVLVTWSAGGAMRVLDIDAHAFDQLSPEADGSFLWQRRKSGFTRQVWFEKDAAAGVTRLRWRGEDGEEGSALKVHDYGYAQEEVRFANGEVALAGTVLTPRGRGPHPAVVFIHGSGTSDRDNLWYFAIADHLARNGIAVLLPDKRGSGQSGGDWRTSGFSDFAHDALAAVALLRTRERIDASLIGLLGISQGGSWIAPLGASQSSEIAFVISVSGAAVTPNEQLLHESKQTLVQYGLPEAMASGMAPGAAGIAKMRRPTWWRKNGDFDPIPFWEKVRVPVLVVYGEDDEKDNVPIQESVVRLNKMIQADRARDFTVTVFPNTGHGMFNAETKWIRKDFLDLLVDWSRSRAKQDWTGAAREGQE